MQSSSLTRLGLAGVLLLSATACEKNLLDQVNPNLPTVETSWKTSDDAVKAATACYAELQGLGMYRRWLNFATDLRDDIGFSQSPWGELADFTRFTHPNYNFEVSNNIWRDHYRLIYRCNQVLLNVPNIAGMDPALQKRVLAEARFLRGLAYYNLVSLYGKVPLALAPPTDLNQTYPQGTEEQVWAQVVGDLQAAQADLPPTYAAGDVGRATKGAATALLGKAYMQTKRWTEAQTQFDQIIPAKSGGKAPSEIYSLTAAYTDNFRHTSENNPESIFEVQFSDINRGGDDASGGPSAASSQGGQRSQFWGVPGFGFNDGEVRPWLVREFLKESTTTGQRDPRLAATVFYNRKDQTQFPTALPLDADTLVYSVGLPAPLGFLTRYGKDARNRARVYWRKYQTDYYRSFEDFDSPINQRVMRYADILLLQAEALNEQGNVAGAIPLINQVRQRASLAPLVAGSFTKETLRTQLMHERALELAGENVRWFDLQRYGMLDNPAGLDVLKARDPDFNSFVVGKSQRLPLLQSDVDLLKLTQNPGY